MSFNFNEYIKKPEVKEKLSKQRKEWCKKNKEKVSWYKCKRHLFLYLDTIEKHQYIYKNLLTKNSAQVGFKHFINNFSNFFESIPKEDLEAYGLNKRVKAYRLAKDQDIFKLREEIKRRLEFDDCNKNKSKYRKKVTISLSTEQYIKFKDLGSGDWLRHMLDNKKLHKFKKDKMQY